METLFLAINAHWVIIGPALLVGATYGVIWTAREIWRQEREWKNLST